MIYDSFMSETNKQYTLEKHGDTWWIFIDGRPDGGGSDGHAGEVYQRQEFQKLKILLGR